MKIKVSVGHNDYSNTIRQEEANTMTTEEFVRELFDTDRNGAGKLTLQDAKNDLRNFQADGWNLPEGMTAEEYMDAWNRLIEA